MIEINLLFINILYKYIYIYIFFNKDTNYIGEEM